MKECCICKKPIDNEGFMTTLNAEVFAHGVCFMELLPYPVSTMATNKTKEELNAQRKIDVEKIAQKLIEDYQAGK